MRKALCVLSLAAATALAASSAQARYARHSYSYEPAYGYAYSPAPVDATVGVVGGTVFGLGLSEGWWGPTLASATFPTTVAGAAAVGGVAGIGGIALVDAVLQPCRGFHAMLDLNEQYCASLNAQQLRHVQRVSSRSHYRHRRYAAR
jgi:hypothetical protein